LLVPLTFLFARRFVSRSWALFAGAIIATSLLHQFFSQQARPHCAAASVFLFGVLASMRLARKPTWKSHLSAALAATVSIGVLHSGLSVLVPLFFALLIAPLSVVHEPANKLYGRMLIAPTLAAAIAIVAVLVFYPFLFHEGPEAAYGTPNIEGTRLVWGDHRIELEDWDGHGFWIVARSMWFYEPTLVVLLAVAAAVWLRRKLPIYRSMERWSDFWVAAAYLFPYLFTIGLFHHTYERFAIPLLPFFATFAAWGLEWWSSRLSPGAKLAVTSFAALSLALPAYATGRIAWLRQRDDSLELASRWLAAQPDVERSRIYVSPLIDLPLARSKESLQPSDKRPAAIFSRWSVYQRRVGPDVVPPPRFEIRYLVPLPDLGFPREKILQDPVAYLRALGPGYFVVDASRQRAREAFVEFRAALRQLGPLVYRSAPEADGPSADFGLHFEDEILPDWPNVIARVLRADCVGPVVEIHRVP